MEGTPSCREHQLEHPTEVSRARLQPRRHGPAGRLATTRSTVGAAAQSGAPADALATPAGPVEWPAPAEAGCPAPPAVVLPHAASTITALTAITASTHRAAASSDPLRRPAVAAGLL